MKLDGWAGFRSAALTSMGKLWRSSASRPTIRSPTNSCLTSATGQRCGNMRRMRSISQSGSGGLWTAFDLSSTTSYEICSIVSNLVALSVAHPHRLLAPLDPSDPTTEASASSQPSSHRNLSGDALSSKQLPIEASSSNLPPNLSPVRSDSLPLDVPSAVAHSPASSASNPRTAPGVSSPTTGNQGPDDDRASSPNSTTPFEALPEVPTAPLTPSNSRSRGTATPVETPSKRPPVQFGSAPDRVLTTAPPKRKTSQRRGGRNTRQPARPKSHAM